MTTDNSDGISITEEAGAVVGILEDIGDQSALFAFNAVLEGVCAHQEGTYTPIAGKMLELAEQAETLAWEVSGMISGIPVASEPACDEPVRPPSSVSRLDVHHAERPSPPKG